MKTTQTVVLAAALCSALFTSCRKSDYVGPDGVSTTPQTARAANNDEATLQFNSGMMSTSLITVQSDGRYLADLGGLRNWDMLHPIAEGGLKLSGAYDNLVTNVRLAADRQGMPVMHLMGTMTMVDGGDQNMGRTVDLTITSPMNLTANSGAIKLTDGTNMPDLLNLHLDRLGAGIPADMWRRAMESSPNVIYISEMSNPELYKMILNNMQMTMTGGNTGGGSTSVADDGTVPQQSAMTSRRTDFSMHP